MPTYEYECTKCGKVFELFQAITERPKRRVKAELKSCDCDAPVVRRIGTGGGLIFKGSGFYQTDYRSDSYKKAEKAEKEAAAPKTDGKSDSKSKDSKPAKKDASTKQPSEAA
jgi:putative FmdB family regulatory protein